MKRLGKKAPIISKIEMPQAIHNLIEIVEESNGIMVARGDLGVELPPEVCTVVRCLAGARRNAEAHLSHFAMPSLSLSPKSASSALPTSRAFPSSSRRRCWRA